MRAQAPLLLTLLTLAVFAFSGCTHGIQGLLPGSLEVIDLDAQRSNAETVRITGSVRNGGNRDVQDIVVTVWLEDDRGDTIPGTERQAKIDVLHPDQQRAFPDIDISYDGQWDNVKAHLDH